MLITMVDVISCENPDCRDFAKISTARRGMRSYYCPVCGTVSTARAIDVKLANEPQLYEAYLRRVISAEGTSPVERPAEFQTRS